MTLVIDCFKLVKGSGKSIGIYNLTLNLVRNLAAEKKNKIIILGTKHNQEDFDIDGVKFVKVKYNPLNKLVCILWELFLVKKALRKIKPDKVLFPRGYAPVRDKIYKSMGIYVIIHDMIPFYYDKNFHGVLNPVENFYIMWRLKASAKLATGVLTDSEYSKKEIVRIAKVNEQKVHVAYPGYNKISTDEVSGEKGVKLAGLKDGEEYICAICSGLPHKNAEGVIKSYIEYHEKDGQHLKLVVIGLANLDEYSFVPNEVAKDIICIKYLEKDSDMHSVMAGAKLFWFLSRQEGFGFPPLEAMQLGVPVISSNASSLPEVTGEAAILVDPENHKEVADKTINLLKSNDIDSYIAKGNANVDRFVWEKQTAEYWKYLG